MRDDVEAAIRSSWETPGAEGAAKVPARVYASADQLDAERRLAFERAWTPVARRSDLSEAGAFVTFELGKVPGVLLAGTDDTPRAFVNVCRHRGAQILREPCGTAKKLTCPYHGFTYDLEGRCVSRPEEASFGGTSAEGLAPLRTGEYGGWVWVTADENAASLHAFLGEALTDELSLWPLEDLDRVAQGTFEGDFDWKIGVEAFLESLHVATIHRRTAHPLIDHRRSAHRELGDHSRMSTPFRSEDAYGPDAPLGAAARDADAAPFAGLNGVQRASNFSYLIFPGVILNLLPNHMTLFRIAPNGLGRTRIHYELLARASAEPGWKAYAESLDPGYRELIREDLENLAWIQRGVASDRVESLELSAHEVRIPAFRAALERWLA